MQRNEPSMLVSTEISVWIKNQGQDQPPSKRVSSKASKPMRLESTVPLEQAA